MKEVNLKLCDQGKLFTFSSKRLTDFKLIQVSENDRLKVKLKSILSNTTVDCQFLMISNEGHKFTCEQDISNETLKFIHIEPSGSISIKEATVLLSTGTTQSLL